MGTLGACAAWPVLERVTRIELAFSAWEADVLPLNYTRRGRDITRLNPCTQMSGSRHLGGDTWLTTECTEAHRITP